MPRQQRAGRKHVDIGLPPGAGPGSRRSSSRSRFPGGGNLGRRQAADKIFDQLVEDGKKRTREQGSADFFAKFGPEARQILEELLEKYAEHGDAQFVLPDVLKVPPLSAHGQVGDIVRLFGGADQLREAVNELQRCLYAA